MKDLRRTIFAVGETRGAPNARNAARDFPRYALRIHAKEINVRHDPEISGGRSRGGIDLIT
jgi:uncharacterized protein YjiK